jgi:hypothetical protein
MTSRTHTFDWDRSEHARVVSLLTRELFATGFRRVIKWVVVALMVVEVLFVVVMAALGEMDVALRLGLPVVLVVVMLLFFYRIAGWIRAWQTAQTDPNVRHPTTHVLDDSGYHIVTHSATIDLRWEGLHKVRETPDFFLIYYSSRYAYYLPKRVVGGAGEIDGVRSDIRRRLPDSIEYERDHG